MQVGKAKAGKRTSVRVLETMVNDYLLKERMLELRHHSLYQPRASDRGDAEAAGENRLFRKDAHGPGVCNTGVRMLGRASKLRLHGVTVTDVRAALFTLFDCQRMDVGLVGNCWPSAIMRGWNYVAVNDCTLELHSFASISHADRPKLDAAMKCSGDVDNSWFAISMPRSAERKAELEPTPTEIPLEELQSLTGIPRDLAKLKYDYDNLTVLFQVCSSGKGFAPCILACLTRRLPAMVVAN